MFKVWKRNKFLFSNRNNTFSFCVCLLVIQIVAEFLVTCIHFLDHWKIRNFYCSEYWHTPGLFFFFCILYNVWHLDSAVSCFCLSVDSFNQDTVCVCVWEREREYVLSLQFYLKVIKMLQKTLFLYHVLNIKLFCFFEIFYLLWTVLFKCYDMLIYKKKEESLS